MLQCMFCLSLCVLARTLKYKNLSARIIQGKPSPILEIPRILCSSFVRGALLGTQMGTRNLTITHCFRRLPLWLKRLLGRRPLLVGLFTFITLAYLLSTLAGRLSSSGNDSEQKKTALKQPQHLLKSPLTKRPWSSPAPPPTPPPPPPPPSAASLVLAIPKVLHHYFGNSIVIPERLAQAVNSWANNHKSYDVYFWDSRYLEKKVFPGLEVFRKYSRCYQADRYTVAKLLILLSMGGVVIDPDLMSVRDFSDFFDGSACIVAQERQEVAALLYGLDSLPSFRFAACRAGHPFLRVFLDHFCEAILRNSTTSLAVATRVAFDYSVTNYDDDCAKRVCDHRDRVVLADAGVFLPVIPKTLHTRLLAECINGSSITATPPLSSLHNRACQSLKDPSDRNLAGAISLAKSLGTANEDGEPSQPLPLERIGPNVGRKAVRNWLLPSPES